MQNCSFEFIVCFDGVGTEDAFHRWPTSVRIGHAGDLGMTMRSSLMLPFGARNAVVGFM